MLLASAWVSHAVNAHAWDEMRELVDSEPERAWKLIQVLVGSASDYDVLAAIAARPVKDLIYHRGESFMPMIEEAKMSARLRICLRATYSELPDDVRQLRPKQPAYGIFPRKRITGKR